MIIMSDRIGQFFGMLGALLVNPGCALVIIIIILLGILALNLIKVT